MEYPALKKAVIAQADVWKANVVLIEDKASGTQLAQELRNTVRGVRAVKCELDKVMRMFAQTPEFEAGSVLLPMHASWLDAYVDELTSFPKAKYDDQVDSTAQALKWITGDGQVDNTRQFFRDLTKLVADIGGRIGTIRITNHAPLNERVESGELCPLIPALASS